MISSVELGVTLYDFPKFGPDLEPMFRYVQMADQMGFGYLQVLDHVVGIVADKHDGIANTPYTDKSEIRECFTLIAHLAAKTQHITFVTGIVGLPQRQTVLVAKQAAEVDIYSGGRFQMGIGVGYNNLEFDAMGADFKTRGKRFEEQVHVLRKLWTERDVSFHGEFHEFVDVSLSPRPLQRPIPLFFGMGRDGAPVPPDAVLERAGRLADGWLPLFKPDNDEARVAINKVHDAARAAGRDPADIKMIMNLHVADPHDKDLIDDIKRRRDFGAGRVSINLRGESAEQQIAFLQVLHDRLEGASD